MYCTFTSSYCTKLGRLLDNEQLAWNVVKTIKAKEDSIRTKEEKNILEKAKQLKIQYDNKAKVYQEIAKELENKPLNFEL